MIEIFEFSWSGIGAVTSDSSNLGGKEVFCLSANGAGIFWLFPIIVMMESFEFSWSGAIVVVSASSNFIDKDVSGVSVNGPEIFGLFPLIIVIELFTISGAGRKAVSFLPSFPKDLMEYIFECSWSGTNFMTCVSSTFGDRLLSLDVMTETCDCPGIGWNVLWLVVLIPSSAGWICDTCFVEWTVTFLQIPFLHVCVSHLPSLQTFEDEDDINALFRGSEESLPCPYDVISETSECPGGVASFAAFIPGNDGWFCDRCFVEWTITVLQIPLVQVLVSHLPFLQVLEDEEEFGTLSTEEIIFRPLWDSLIGSKLTVWLLMAEVFAGNTVFSVDWSDGNLCTGGPSYTESVSWKD